MNEIHMFLLTAFAGIYLVWKIYADGMHLADKATHNRLMGKIMEQQKQLSVADGAYNSCKFQLEEANKIIKTGREANKKQAEEIGQLFKDCVGKDEVIKTQEFQYQQLNKRCDEVTLERNKYSQIIVQQQNEILALSKKKISKKRKAK